MSSEASFERKAGTDMKDGRVVGASSEALHARLSVQPIRANVQVAQMRVMEGSGDRRRHTFYTQFHGRRTRFQLVSVLEAAQVGRKRR